MPTLRSILDRVTHPLGIHLARFQRQVATDDSGPPLTVETLRSIVTEIEGCYREHVFRGLPPRNRRPEMMTNLLGTSPSEAMYIVHSLHQAIDLPGDVCEFGVAQGVTSALIANEIRDTTKRLWLFDSFQGLPKPTAEDALINDIFNLGSIDAYSGTMAYDVGFVQRQLEKAEFPLSRVQIVPGFIETTSKLANLPETVCFAYVDFDFYQPILVALELLHPRLPSQGRIVVDDYGWFSSGAQKAVDRFVAAHADAYELTFPNKAAGHFALLRKK